MLQKKLNQDAYAQWGHAWGSKMDESKHPLSPLQQRRELLRLQQGDWTMFWLQAAGLEVELLQNGLRYIYFHILRFSYSFLLEQVDYVRNTV